MIRTTDLVPTWTIWKILTNRWSSQIGSQVISANRSVANSHLLGDRRIQPSLYPANDSTIRRSNAHRIILFRIFPCHHRYRPQYTDTRMGRQPRRHPVEVWRSQGEYHPHPEMPRHLSFIRRHLHRRDRHRFSRLRRAARAMTRAAAVWESRVRRIRTRCVCETRVRIVISRRSARHRLRLHRTTSGLPRRETLGTM